MKDPKFSMLACGLDCVPHAWKTGLMVARRNTVDDYCQY